MTTSVERAREAFAKYGLFPSEPERYGEPARAVLTVALDRDEIARVLGEHTLLRTERFGMEPDGWYCDGCGALIADRGSTSTASQVIAAHRADAVIAHLLRED